MPRIGTINEEGQNVDLYIPRKCHATNRLIVSNDYASIQIAVADVGPNGVINGKTSTFCISGHLRRQGESDHAINHLAISRGIMRIRTGKPPKADKKKFTKAPVKVTTQAKGRLAAKGRKPGTFGDRKPGTGSGARRPQTGERRPPRADGERRPPRADGERRPPRADGERRPPRADGDRRPPRPQGQRAPAAKQ